MQPMKFVEGPAGKKIAVSDVGPRDAPAILLVSGWPQSLYCWRHVQPMLVQKGFRAIAIDPPGLGASDLLEPGLAYTTPAIASHLAASVAALGIDRYLLVGHDIGAWISFAWAAAYSEEMVGLVLLDAAIPGAMKEAAFPLEKASGIFQFYFNAVPDLPEQLTQGRERLYLDWLFKAKVRKPDSIGPEAIDQYLKWYGQPARMSAGFEYYRAVPASIAALGSTTQIGVPTLALGGEFALGASMAQALGPHCPNLEGGSLAGSGHFIPEEAPEQLVEQLVAFAGKVGA